MEGVKYEASRLGMFSSLLIITTFVLGPLAANAQECPLGTKNCNGSCIDSYAACNPYGQREDLNTGTNIYNGGNVDLYDEGQVAGTIEQGWARP